MKPTPDDLRNFAETNGLIMYRLTAEDFMEDLDEDGNCPSGFQCPCQGAIDCKREDDVLKQKCAFSIFCTPKYAEYINGFDNEDEDIPDPTEPVDPEVRKKALEIIDFEKEMEKLLDKGEIAQMAEELSKKSEETNCGICAEYFGAQALHAAAAKTICELNEDACATEEESLRKNLAEMMRLYRIVGGIKRPKNEDGKVEYHACMSQHAKDEDLATVLEDATEEGRRKGRLWILSKLCAGKFQTVEEAGDALRQEKPEYFKNGGLI